MEILNRIQVKYILYAAAAITVLPIAGVAVGAAGGGIAAACFGAGLWYAAGAVVLGGALGLASGYVAGAAVARHQIEKIAADLLAYAGETILTRFAKKFLPKEAQEGPNAEKVVAPEIIHAVAESFVDTKPKSLRGMKAFSTRAAIKVALQKRPKTSKENSASPKAI